MTETFTCPRRKAEGRDRDDSPFALNGSNKDTWREGGMGKSKRVCSYDGSMHPDDFMQVVRDGVEIGPTDKSYKFYVGDMDGKFYTHHLSPEQSQEFWNLACFGKVNWGYPGRPYVPLYLPGATE